MSSSRDLYRSLLPACAAFIVLVGQPVATWLVIVGSAHRQDAAVELLTPVWYVLFLPSEIFALFFRALTGQSPRQVFGGYTADVYLGLGLNAVGWALIVGLVCAVVQKRLTKRCS